MKGNPWTSIGYLEKEVCFDPLRQRGMAGGREEKRGGGAPIGALDHQKKGRGAYAAAAPG